MRSTEDIYIYNRSIYTVKENVFGDNNKTKEFSQTVGICNDMIDYVQFSQNLKDPVGMLVHSD